MKYLKGYNESKWGAVGKVRDIQSHYSIYDWFEDLKEMLFGGKTKNIDSLRKWTEHFIGNGYFDKISKRAKDINISRNKIDIENINDRMLEVWDELPTDIEKKIILGISYSGGGTLFASEELDIIIHMLTEIVYPTLYIGYPSVLIRHNDEQFYVHDDKWNCKNFNIDSYEIEEGSIYDNGGSRRNTTTIFKTDIDKKRVYSVDDIIELYKPCLIIHIEGYSLRLKVKLSKLEPMLDDVLETILPTLDYSEVIWDKSRGTRKFVEDEFYDYTLKILLK